MTVSEILKIEHTVRNKEEMNGKLMNQSFHESIFQVESEILLWCVSCHGRKVLN
jgi:hypothetical protein